MRQTFAHYMEQRLYGEDGYYASGQAQSGRQGDYFTAVDTGPAFSVLLGAVIREWMQLLPVRPFHIVEMGAGTGKLAGQLLDVFKNGDSTAKSEWVYTAIERSPARLKAIGQRPEVAAGTLRAFERLANIPDAPLKGCFFANELVDALPVHRVRMREGRLEEGFIDENQQWHWDKPSTDTLADYLARAKIQLPNGYETEINLAMRAWIGEVSRTLESGFVVVIDYGRPAWQYYDPERNGGTLRGFSGHRVVSLDHPSPRPSPLKGEGEGEHKSLDLTSDVDFTSLALDAREQGLTPLAFMEMGTFLMMGARLWLARDPKAKAPAGLRYLVHPEGMGAAFHVLVLGKGIDPQDWTFEGNRLKRLQL